LLHHDSRHDFRLLVYHSHSQGTELSPTLLSAANLNSSHRNVPPSRILQETLASLHRIIGFNQRATAIITSLRLASRLINYTSSKSAEPIILTSYSNHRLVGGSTIARLDVNHHHRRRADPRSSSILHLILRVPLSITLFIVSKPMSCLSIVSNRIVHRVVLTQRIPKIILIVHNRVT
jgi:hypothetical protein